MDDKNNGSHQNIIHFFVIRKKKNKLLFRDFGWVVVALNKKVVDSIQNQIKVVLNLRITKVNRIRSGNFTVKSCQN